MDRLLRECGFTPVQESMHFQTLRLGYVLARLSPFSSGLSRFARGIVGALGLQNLPFTYYASQLNVVARKPVSAPQG